MVLSKNCHKWGRDSHPSEGCGNEKRQNDLFSETIWSWDWATRAQQRALRWLPKWQKRKKGTTWTKLFARIPTQNKWGTKDVGPRIHDPGCGHLTFQSKCDSECWEQCFMFGDPWHLAQEFHSTFSSPAPVCKHLQSKTRNVPKSQPRG